MWVRVPPEVPILLDFVKENVTVAETGCWEWRLSFSSNGYPQKLVNGRIRTVHRALMEELGLVSPDEVVRHLCHNKACCNPDHLAAGSQAQNYRDSAERYKEANRKRRKKWTIGNTSYETCREMSAATGLPMSSVIKFTVNGVFDLDSYRDSCGKAGWKPKL